MPADVERGKKHGKKEGGREGGKVYRREGGDQEGAIDVGHIEKCGPDVVCDSVMFITTAVCQRNAEAQVAPYRGTSGSLFPTRGSCL